MDPPLRTCLGLSGPGQVLFYARERFSDPLRSAPRNMNVEPRISNFATGETSFCPARFEYRYSIFPSILLLFAHCLPAQAEASHAKPTPANPLTAAFAQIIENAIPREYQKSKDWGNTKNVTVGLRADGWKIHRRKKPVKHGVWKRYRVRLAEPEKRLNVEIRGVRPLENGGFAFTLALKAKFDLWARAKVYQHGIHLIALEADADATIDLEVDCQLAVHLHTQEGRSGVALDPRVIDSRLNLVDFNLHRVSNAKGPIVRELGEELPGLLKKELQGPKLVAKLNRAIDKKRERLELAWSEVF